MELRYVPRVFGSGPNALYPGARGFYDEVDLSVVGTAASEGTFVASNEGFLQLVTLLGQKLVRIDPTGVRDFVRLDVGQGFDLKAGSRADAFARLTASVWQLSGTATVRYDVPAQRLAQISAGLAYRPRPGVSASAQYDNLIARAGSDNLRRGIDLLVGHASTLFIRPEDRAQTLSARAEYKFKFGLGIGFEAIAAPTIPDPLLGLGSSPLWTLQQQTLGVSLSPSCDCWRLDFFVRSRLQVILPSFRSSGPETPDFNLSLNIARFGSFGLY
jgi:LPS-assembly protein